MQSSVLLKFTLPLVFGLIIGHTAYEEIGDLVFIAHMSLESARSRELFQTAGQRTSEGVLHEDIMQAS